MRRLHFICQRLTHQAYDQLVALDGAHALLQLAQDGVLVLNVEALCLPVERRARWLYSASTARALGSS